MAIVTASSLEDNQRGFGFAAIWTLFLVIFLKILGQYVLGGSARGCAGQKVSQYSTPLLTGHAKCFCWREDRALTNCSFPSLSGFWLGTTFMLSIAFFILGCVFSAFSHPEIKTLGAFYLVSPHTPIRICILVAVSVAVPDETFVG